MRSHDRQRAFLVPAADSPVSPSSLCCTDDRRRAIQRSFTSSPSANDSISTRLNLLSTTPVRNPMMRRHSLSCQCQPSQKMSFSTTREAAWRIVSVASVCLSVCNAITVESLDVGSSFSYIWYNLQEKRVKFVCEGHRVKSRS